MTQSGAAALYPRMKERLKIVRKRLGRPLTLSEKVLFGHLADPRRQALARGKSLLSLRPDRVAMQDATAQMALLQFSQAGFASAAVPVSIHCDHLICARQSAGPDLRQALKDNREVYDFLRSAARRYGMDFWSPGAGIIHQIVLENYAFPGGLLIGTDSHTPNAGGLAMMAHGVGGADAVDAMAGLPWEVLCPGLIGVRLTGKLRGWASPKDIILSLCGKLSTRGGTNRVIEYFGPGASTLSATGKATITNMGAEMGATASLFPFDPAIAAFLRATGRNDTASAAERHADLLTADPETGRVPEKHYDTVLEIDLSELEPRLAGPHTPGTVRPVSVLGTEVRRKKYPKKISAVLIGSCTDSSYEDLGRAASVARQAAAAGVRMPGVFLISPGSETVFRTVLRDGILADLRSIGAVLLANACGPCIGQWKRSDVPAGMPNTILTTFNRNFQGRNDGNPATLAFMGSPETVTAMGLSGTLGFDPARDTIALPGGGRMALNMPEPVPAIPPRGFVLSTDGLVRAGRNGRRTPLKVSPRSERLQLLQPFPAWDGRDLIDLPILIKARGKCTTDHISPAGKWLRYRGHLDRISDNLFGGAQNSFTGKPGLSVNVLTGEQDLPAARVARDYKARGLRWIAVGDENYGEGSSREHAAMSPRYLGAAAVIARSFARIHETNLKKQGILPLTFSRTGDYDRLSAHDRISLTGLKSLAPGKPVRAVVVHKNGKRESLTLKHTLSRDQIGWFKAGSALNALEKR